MNTTNPKPIYTTANCRPAYQLNWSLTLFWRVPPTDSDWLAELIDATEKDGVRILNYSATNPEVSQFLLSTTPEITPQAIIRSVKGRLQYIIRDKCPKAFRRNYSINSVGSVKRKVVERYVSSQLNHQRMADARVQAKLQRFQIHRTKADLSRVMNSAHGIYIYNLHLVLVNHERWMQIRSDILEKIRHIMLRVSEKKGHRLSEGAIFPDHIHMTLGCNISESPGEVALSYLNNLAHAQGMRPVYQAGYYVGTFGEYDLGALGSCQSSPHGGKPRGGG